MSATAFVDACGFIPASSGTGDFVVSTNVVGYQTPAAASAVNAAVYSYRAESPDKSQWEEGFGAYTVGTTTLARTTVTANSSGGAGKITFSAAPNVYITALSADLQNALLITSGLINTARLGSSPIGSGLKALFDDQSWKTFAAAKSDQTTATSTAVAVTPAVQQNHDSALKAWVKFTGSTGAILAGYNVSSITRNATGDYTVNFTTAFASSDYFGMAIGAGSGLTVTAAMDRQANGTAAAPTTSAQRFSTYATFTGGAAVDTTTVYYQACGRQ